jgi:UDP-N-acetylglucosamine acyltransferase
MAAVHATALVDPGAELADDVEIGPYCIVGPQVRLGAGVVLDRHVVIEGRTHLEAGVRVHAFAALGGPPQDVKYRGEDTGLTIGARSCIREHVTAHRGTPGGGGETRVGADCMLMVASHVAHDCTLGDRTMLANQAALGGHVRVGADCFLGGLSAVHQGVRIGHGVMIGGLTGVERDVIPYGLAMGDRARLAGLNLVGLKRRGADKAELHRLRSAYRTLFHGPTGDFEARLEHVARDYADTAKVGEIVAFIHERGRRALCQARDAHDEG